MLGVFMPPPEDDEPGRRYVFNINALNGFYNMKGPNLDSTLEVDRRMAARRARVRAAHKRKQSRI